VAVETLRAGLSRLTTTLFPGDSPQRREAMDKPVLQKATLAFVLGTGMVAAIGLGILSAWAWSTPEVSIWLKAVLPLLTVGIVALEVMLGLALRRKARER
jgi:hypothetical protein